jgi:hypothetical protein
MFDVLQLFEVLHHAQRTREGAKELGYRRDTSSVNGTFSLAASFQAVEAISLPGRGSLTVVSSSRSNFPPAFARRSLQAGVPPAKPLPGGGQTGMVVGPVENAPGVIHRRAGLRG